MTRDVADQLGASVSASTGGQTLVLRGPLDRDSLRLAVVTLPTAHQRLGWLAARLGELPGSGIVYTLTVAAAQETAAFLREQGLTVASYTGRDEPEERARAEDDLLANRVKALVATSALGMGFDKPDLGFVVHLGAPQSPVAYYQQIGRAGRAMSRAEVILLPGHEDRDIWAYFASLAFPPERQVRAALAALAEADRPMSASVLETRVDLSRGRLESMLKVLDVDGAVRRVSGGWTSTGQPWHYDGERYERVAAERAREQQAMLAYQATDGCRMEYLRRQLDDPAAAPCGRCDNCTGQQVLGEVPETSATAARERLLRPGVQVEPRRMWPTGLKALGLDVAGKIPASQTAEPGRAIGRLTDIGWGGMLRALLAEDAPDEPVTEPVVAAAIKVLAAWDWAQRPAGVLTLPSRTRPRLITSLGQRLASVGRLPYLGALAYTERRRRRPAASQQRAAAELPVARARGARRHPCRRRRPGRPGARRRRPHRDRVDDDGRGPAAPRGGRQRRPAPRAGRQCRARQGQARRPGRLGDVGFGAVLADHGAARDGPAGHAVGHVDGVQAGDGQRLGRVGRPGAAAADHVHLTVAGQFVRPGAELTEPHVHRVGGVARRPLVVFTHVKQEHPGRQVRRQHFGHDDGLVHVVSSSGLIVTAGVAGRDATVPPSRTPGGPRPRPPPARRRGEKGTDRSAEKARAAGQPSTRRHRRGPGFPP